MDGEVGMPFFDQLSKLLETLAAELERTRELSARVLNYIEGTLRASPVLAQLIVSRTADTIELTTGIICEVRPANFRTLRGLSCVGITCDEIEH